MALEEFKALFLGKLVVIHGMSPGKDSPEFYFHGEVGEAWETRGHIGFKAGRYAWTRIDYWRKMNGELFGFYTSVVYSKEEPGIIRITEAGN